MLRFPKSRNRSPDATPEGRCDASRSSLAAGRSPESIRGEAGLSSYAEHQPDFVVRAIRLAECFCLGCDPVGTLDNVEILDPLHDKQLLLFKSDPCIDGEPYLKI